ncbi:MAG: patatin-like phospholipase family protein [Firmicutes bacterium]|nr:patatin-like phospholipase family protein [Bacillota bacterium]
MKRALVLSGGGSRGAYQIGVWQAMRELGMDIDIVTGTSVGAINASMVVTDAFDTVRELWKDVETNMIFDLDNESRYNEAKTEIIKNTRGFMGMPVAEALSYAKFTITQGGAGSDGLLGIIEKYLDLDAFYASPIEFGLVTAQLPKFKGHYLFKEDIPREKLHRYILASASCFPAAQYMKIDDMRLVDGGYADNLPIDMAMEKGATDMVAVNMEAIGIVKEESLERAKTELNSFTYITSPWELGNFLCFDPDTNKRNIILGHFDAMKAFGKLDGHYYTFEKGAIPKRLLGRADAAARIFQLDYLKTYTADALNDALAAKVKTAVAARERQVEKLLPIGRMMTKSSANQLVAAMRNRFSQDILTCVIAADLKEKEARSAFLSKHLIHRLKTEVLAAAYLLSDPSLGGLI